jgi:hypothetical protein
MRLGRGGHAVGYWCAFLACGVFAMTRAANAQSNASFPEPAAPSPPRPGAFAPPAVSPTPAPAQPTPAPTTARPTAAPAPVASPAPTAAAAQVPSAAPALPPYQPPVGLAALPPLLPYKKGLSVPPGYRVVERPATGLTIGGGLTFAAAYVAALGLAASQSFENGTAYTVIPVAGPWAAIGGRSFKCQVPVVTGSVSTVVLQQSLNKCVGFAFDEVTTVVFLTADGLVQATGAALFLIGLASGHEELVRQDLPKAAVYPLPEGGMAFSLHGRF